MTSKRKKTLLVIINHVNKWKSILSLWSINRHGHNFAPNIDHSPTDNHSINPPCINLQGYLQTSIVLSHFNVKFTSLFLHYSFSNLLNGKRKPSVTFSAPKAHLGRHRNQCVHIICGAYWVSRSLERYPVYHLFFAWSHLGNVAKWLTFQVQQNCPFQLLYVHLCL